jgi:hypothetical protein
MTRDGSRRRGGTRGRRGQTLHDYIAGISVFVLTITAVLGLLPAVTAPYDAGGNAADVTIAERIGDRVVSNLSSPNDPNVLNTEAFETAMTLDDEGLQDRYGLEEYRNVNVSLRTMNGSRVVRNGAGARLSAGANAVGNDAATAARVVTMTDRPADCDPACRLVVRVW